MEQSDKFLKQNEPQMQFEFMHEVLFLVNNVTLHEIDRLYNSAWKEIKHYKNDELKIDLRFVKEMDSSGVAFIEHIKAELQRRKIEVSIQNASKSIQEILTTFTVPAVIKNKKNRKQNIFDWLGNKVYNFITISLLEFIYLTADLFYWTFVDLFQKKAHRKGEFVNQAVNIGVNAVPIVGLLSFMIGLVSPIS